MLTPLFLLTLVSLTMGYVYKMPLVRVEPQRIQMMREGKWAMALKQMNAERLMRKASAGAVYNQSVLLETGTADFWVPDASCAPPPRIKGCDESECDAGATCKIFCPKVELCCGGPGGMLAERKYTCTGKNVYDPTKSATYVKMEGSWLFEYNNGFVQGLYANDTVRFGTEGEHRLTVPGTGFGRAVRISKYLMNRSSLFTTWHKNHQKNDYFSCPFEDYLRKIVNYFIAVHYNLICVLGPSGIYSRFDGVLGLGFTSLALTETIQPFVRAHRLGLVEPIFTVHMRQVGVADNVYGGAFTWGGIDTENCGNLIAYQEVSLVWFWQFRLRNVSVGSYVSNTGWDVALDTASAFIGAPHSVVKGVAKALDAEYSPEEDAYFVDCDGYPKLQFGIGENIYTVKGDNFKLTLEEYKCILPIYAMDSVFLGPSWIFGAPFMRQYCTIFDMKMFRIGFANSLQEE
ncbi:eukaryotic aspartyl protease [Necator americanus]|uniref:Eukaryotic aspartyl protease n=1 Tax=Necator americanus TaxID=51031 RepID=W2TW90_NECAM|nr:eukaryotic aspartyl protease [Necator americanus]ETN85267.1 eukaryotic aspartyl protease [Necator americanus]